MRLPALGLVLLFAAGWAQPTTVIPIDPASLPGQLADKYPRICDPELGGGPHVGAHIWIFALPEGSDAEFVSVDVLFASASGLRGGSGGGVRGRFAWVGEVATFWGIVRADARITGTAESFVVKGTCPAAQPTSSPSPAPTRTGGDTLPKTGPGRPPLGLIALGGVAVAAGAALRFMYRRRRPI